MRKKILVLATAGAGGDLQPLIAVALKLSQRGDELVFAGDSGVKAALQPLGIETVLLPTDIDLSPRLIAAVKDAQKLEGSAQGELVRQRLSLWSAELAPTVRQLIRQYRPHLLLTSLFGVDVVALANSDIHLPWCVINSTFYVGPNPPRDLDQDFAARAVPLFRYYSSLLAKVPLVLHATDQVFDYRYSQLPLNHHYVGPLIWEPAAQLPAYLDEPGEPWVLATISSQLQDDILLARAALNALAQQPVRVVLTLGSDHQLAEIGPVPPNARIEKYIPHSSVLERSRLLISHAGHGSVMKALWHGVPMVLIPWGRDQPGVAARAENLGVAKVIARDILTDQHLTDAISSVLADHAFRDNAHAVAQRLQKYDPVATACEFLDQI